jgi:hypothetical protein
MSSQNGRTSPNSRVRLTPLLASVFSIDPRSLALFRIGIACNLLVDLLSRFHDISSMYSDDGMFSRAEICRRYSTIWNWSFHFSTGSGAGEVWLFGLAAFLAIALLLGWQTRLATIGSWLMLLSVHHRVPPILSGADILLRMLLFWAMFLPLGQAWSVDARRPGKPSPLRVFSIGSAAILLQMAMMYLFSAIFKTNANWLNGDAITGSLQHSFFASPAAGFLLGSPILLKLFTLGTLFLEWAGPFLLLLPLRTPWVKLGTIMALSAMHVGIWIFMEVDLFSPVALSGLMLFIPQAFWQRFFKSAAPTNAPVPTHSFAMRISSTACAVALAYIVALNINTLHSHPLNGLSLEKWNPLFVGCGFGQKWGMFETAPSNNGWYVAKARLNDGSEIDLLRNGAPLNWDKPKFPAGIYPSFRWRKIFREMSYFDEQGYQVFRAPVADYLCRNWNATHPTQQIANFELIFCHEVGGVPGNFLRPAVTREQFVAIDLAGS